MRIALLHGNDHELLETLAVCGSVDMLGYGHTHRPEVMRDGSLLIVNQGGVNKPLTDKNSVDLVDTGRSSAEIVKR